MNKCKIFAYNFHLFLPFLYNNVFLSNSFCKIFAFFLCVCMCVCEKDVRQYESFYAKAFLYSPVLEKWGYAGL